jgi:hypothetical protein
MMSEHRDASRMRVDFTRGSSWYWLKVQQARKRAAPKCHGDAIVTLRQRTYLHIVEIRRLRSRLEKVFKSLLDAPRALNQTQTSGVIQ